tara:strand:- start:625 stop:1287 length:663 start_codon:yes stop_codon:yes gene_type:complete
MAGVKIAAAANGGSAEIAGPPSSSANTVLKLPADTGAAGKVLAVKSANHSSTNAELEWATAASGGLWSSYAIICDEKSTGTSAGGFTKDAWQDRELNTEITDPDGIVSINSTDKTFTLQAGTYLIEWSAPAYKVTDHISRLYDVTGTAALATGFNQYAHDNYGLTMSRSEGFYRHIITASNTYKIQHYCNWTNSTNGFGFAVPPADATEKYTWVKIYKEV